MPQAGAIRLIGAMTSEEVSRRLKDTSILCLPMGSIEQHGPHLPLNTDLVLAGEYTRRMIARWGEALDLWQLPAQPVGLAREHDWAAGTLSLSVAGMAALMHDLASAISRSLPARNLAIVNGHGGNRGVLDALAQELRGDFGFNVCVLYPPAWIAADGNAAVPDIHGGTNETSMMLAAAPHLVSVAAIAQLNAPPDGDAVRRTILDAGATWPWTSDDKRIADHGVIGDAKAASAELGAQLLDRIAETAGGYLRQLLDNQHLARR